MEFGPGLTSLGPCVRSPKDDCCSCPAFSRDFEQHHVASIPIFVLATSCVISGLSRYFPIFLKHPECTTQFDETTLVCHYKYLSLNFLQPVPQQQVLISHYAIQYSNSVTLSCDKLSENVSNSKLLRRSTEQHVRPVGSIPRLPIHRRCSIGSRGNGVVCEHLH